MGWLRIVVGVFGLIALGFFAQKNPPVQSIADILHSPQKFTGTSVTLYVETHIDSVLPTRFRIRERSHHLWVHGQVDPKSVGETVTLDGIVRPDTTLALNQIRISKNRIHKMWTSALAAFIIGLFLVAVLTLNDNALMVDDHA